MKDSGTVVSTEQHDVLNSPLFTQLQLTIPIPWRIHLIHFKASVHFNVTDAETKGSELRFVLTALENQEPLNNMFCDLYEMWTTRSRFVLAFLHDSDLDLEMGWTYSTYKGRGEIRS